MERSMFANWHQQICRCECRVPVECFPDELNGTFPERQSPYFSLGLPFVSLNLGVFFPWMGLVVYGSS